MAYNTVNDLFKAIADAIRTKTGKTEKIATQDMPAEIANIETGGGSEDWKISNLDCFFQANTSVNNYKNIVYFHDIMKHVDKIESAYLLFYNGITTITTGYVTNEIFNAILEKGINNVKNLERVCYNNAYELSGDFVMNIDNCTTLYQFFYNNRVVDETTFSIDFNGSTGKVENFSYTFGGGSTKFYVPVTAIYNINMDVATNVAAFTSYAKFLTTITFDGSFGGKTTTSTLTLDLSTTGITLETFKNMVNSMDPCTNGKTRNIKVKSSLFSQIEVDDIYIDAIEKGYSITS